MKRLALVLAVAAAGIAPASAKEKCTSMCHLFDAWAMAQSCPNLTLIHNPTNDRTYREDLDPRSRVNRELMADALKVVKQQIALHPQQACHVDCKGTDDDEGTVCQYVSEKQKASTSELLTCRGKLVERGDNVSLIVGDNITCVIPWGGAGHDPTKPCIEDELCRLTGRGHRSGTTGQTYSIDQIIDIDRGGQN